MAAQRVMSGMPEWPELDRYRVDAATLDAMAQGRALYHDEVRGCVRCHGPRGLNRAFQNVDARPLLNISRVAMLAAV